MKKILIFIGPPGSGKGTQGKKVANQHNYAHISTGALLRERLKSGDYPPDEAKVLPRIREGHLVPPWLVYRLTFTAVAEALKEKAGVVLDGAIRNLEQAGKFQEFFKANHLGRQVQVIHVALSDEESFNRLTHRRVCLSCRANIPWLDSTKNITRCPYCKGRLARRQDDTESVIRERIKKQGNEALKPIVDFYEKLGILTTVDGSGSIDEVALAVGKALK